MLGITLNNVRGDGISSIKSINAIEENKRMDSYRKVLNQRQTELRRVMLSFNQHDKAIELFLSA